jgi:hypothetical protein
MKKINVKLDKEVTRWARTRAAERNIEVSRLLGEMLREKMQEEEAYLLVMEQYLAAGPQVLKNTGPPYPDREEVHKH